ncbi:MAG: ABC transporter substrate-binding protein [Proteobacteria bacterium]|nr:ABC transporter substrate-binding protein [Pseudomonadota bacterium]MBI3495962.1 ABC transporter substrate-binding protein [Pseudomonadota bacterium]
MLAFALLASPAGAVDAPRRGGVLTFSVTGEPETYDCHASVSVAVVHRVAPHYSLLLRVDPAQYPKIESDLALSWAVSGDGLAYRFKLRRGVTFHDGSSFGAADIKATYERLRNPPAGINSVRRSLLDDVAAIETPDEATVVFRLKQVNPAMSAIFASPWNCVYSAARLARDPNDPQRTVMGTGPFRFVEHAPGSHWTGERYAQYFLPDRPYLDGFRAIELSTAALVNALAGGQIQADFRGIPPAARDRLASTAGTAVKFAEGPMVAELMLTFNTARKPFDDVRVRQALSLAIDRWGGSGPLARQMIVGDVGGFMRPGSDFALGADELVRMPGFSRDIAASRSQARRLLADSGLGNFSFTFTNRPPYTPLGVFLLDQWRQIGVTVKHEQPENGPFFAARSSGNFDAVIDASNQYMDEPTLQLDQFLSFDRSASNVSHSTDRTLDSLFDRQARSADPGERRRLVGEFEKRLLTEAYSIPLFWSWRIVPLAKSVEGFHIAPSYYLGQDLSTIWLKS